MCERLSLFRWVHAYRRVRIYTERRLKLGISHTINMVIEFLKFFEIEKLFRDPSNADSRNYVRCPPVRNFRSEGNPGNQIMWLRLVWSIWYFVSGQNTRSPTEKNLICRVELPPRIFNGNARNNFRIEVCDEQLGWSVWIPVVSATTQNWTKVNSLRLNEWVQSMVVFDNHRCEVKSAN